MKQTMKAVQDWPECMDGSWRARKVEFIWLEVDVEGDGGERAAWVTTGILNTFSTNRSTVLSSKHLYKHRAKSCDWKSQGKPRQQILRALTHGMPIVQMKSLSPLESWPGLSARYWRAGRPSQPIETRGAAAGGGQLWTEDNIGSRCEPSRYNSHRKP